MPSANQVPPANPQGRLAGRVAFISGGGCVEAGWTIGSAVAALFAREGATVYAIDRSAEALDSLARALEGLGATLCTEVVDASSLDEVTKAVCGVRSQIRANRRAVQQRWWRSSWRTGGTDGQAVE